jgi:ABC-type transport system substrate-binding protein
MSMNRRQPRGNNPFVYFCRIYFSFVGILWLVAPLLSADTPGLNVPKRSGTLRLAVQVDPHSLDPAQVFSSEEAMLSSLLFDTLLDPSPQGAFLPVLAETLPSTSLDALTHTFRLRSGVLFSNGRELVADDVVFTLERFFDPKTSAATPSYFRCIEGGLAFEEARKQEAASRSSESGGTAKRWIEPVTVSGLRAMDRRTVQIRLTKTDLSFLHAIACLSAAIVPREEVERAGGRFAAGPVGTGPFVLREWIRGVRLRFERNPLYFRAGQPHLDAVDVLVNVDQTTQTMMFERGEIDFQRYLADPDFLRFQNSPDLQPLLKIVTGTSPTFIFMNCEMLPFTNRLVRVALNHAVNKEALVKTLLHRCVPMRGPLPMVVSGFNRDLPEYQYDPSKARELLKEAGFPNGFETTLWTAREHTSWVKMALFVQQNLREVGVSVQLKLVSLPTLLEASGRRGTVPMGVWNWTTTFDDPKETLDTLLNGDNIIEANCSNNAFYANPQVRQLFRDAAAEADVARRLQLYHQIESMVVQDAPWIFLVQMNTEMLLQPWLKGFTPRGFWPAARFENSWLEQ